YYTMDAEERKQSQAPYVDRRIYTSWNAALAIAYLDAGKQELAAKLLDSLFKRAYRPGEGMTHAEGADGQLGDQVWSLFAAVRAYQHGLGDRWIEIALELSAHIEERYGDSELRASATAVGVVTGAKHMVPAHTTARRSPSGSTATYGCAARPARAS